MEARFQGIGNLVAAGLGIYQGIDHNRKTHAHEQRQHEEEMKLLREQHEREMTIAKQTYLISTFTDIEQYCQELNENLINSSKDAERDMVDQRNQQFQTILLAGTIMIAALVNMMIQGNLPASSGNFVFLLYAASSAGSFLFLILNILICIEIASRVTKFMHKRSRGNIVHLSHAMKDTKVMMRRIRGETSSIMHHPSNSMDEVEEGEREDRRRGGEEEEEEEEGRSFRIGTMGGMGALGMTLVDRGSAHLVDAGHGTATATTTMGLGGPDRYTALRSGPRKRKDEEEGGSAGVGRGMGDGVTLKRQRSMDETDQIDDHWRRHEAEIHKFLARREKINDKIEMLAPDSENNNSRISFQNFWNETCKHLGNTATFFFYCGTALMLIATMTFMWAQGLHKHKSFISAVFGVTAMSIALVAGGALAIYLRYFDQSIQRLKATLIQEEAQERTTYFNRIAALGRSSFSNVKVPISGLDTTDGDSRKRRASGTTTTAAGWGYRFSLHRAAASSSGGGGATGAGGEKGNGFTLRGLFTPRKLKTYDDEDGYKA